MEQFSISKTEHGLHVDGFPDAIRLIGIKGPKGERLAHLTLHKSDLDFAFQCLTAINEVAEHPPILRQALWRTAIIHFIKCFGKSKSRFSLKPIKVYKNDPGASQAFQYFNGLRNKNVVHDENSYAQALPGAVLNKKGAPFKIAKIVCLDISGATLTQGNFSKLHLLISLAREWVHSSFEELCNALTTEYESKTYEELLVMDEITYKVPTAEDIHKAKPTL